MTNGDVLAYKQPVIRLVDNAGMLEEAEPQGPGFLERRALDLGIMTMAQPTKPYWNVPMVTAWVAVIGLIVVLLGAVGSLYVYTRDTSKADGIQIGIQQERDRQNVKEREDQAKEIETLKRAAGLLPPEPKKEKK